MDFKGWIAFRIPTLWMIGVGRMARINIEDSLYKDKRWEKLLIKTGDSRIAKGAILEAFTLAQEHFQNASTEGLIPFRDWEISDMHPALLDSGVAEKREKGIYVMGMKTNFVWLEQKSNAGRKSAETRKAKLNEAERNSTDVNGCSTDVNGCSTESNGSQPPTHSLSPTHSPSLNTPPTPQGDGVGVQDIKSAQQKSTDDLYKIAKGKVKLDEVMGLYNQILAGTGKLKHCRDVGDVTRREFLNSLDAYPTLDEWKVLFECVRRSKKLTGQVPTTFMGTFSWLVKKENALKVEQGSYDDDFEQVAEVEIKNNLKKLELN